jgi:hypothetical protein
MDYNEYTSKSFGARFHSRNTQMLTLSVLWSAAGKNTNFSIKAPILSLETHPLVPNSAHGREEYTYYVSYEEMMSF